MMDAAVDLVAAKVSLRDAPSPRALLRKAGTKTEFMNDGTALCIAIPVQLMTMAFFVSKRAIPQCSACIQNHLRFVIGDVSGPASSLRQQIRGKKKMVNNTGTSIVQLLKDKPEYGRKGQQTSPIHVYSRSNILTSSSQVHMCQFRRD
jgi:hypothetical protein